MAAIYTAGVVTTVPYYDIQAPHMVANVINWHTASTGLTQIQINAIQAAFNNAWLTWYLPNASTATFYKGAVVLDMSNALGLKADNSLFVAQPGTGSPGPVGDQTAFLLSLKGQQRYRGGHSRIYIPGFGTTQSNNDGRTWTPSTVTAVQNGWTSVVTAMAAVSPANGGPLTPVIWHKKKTGSPAFTEPVVGALGSAVYATQRRRLRKVSRHKKKTTP